MHKQCVPGSFLSALTHEPKNEASMPLGSMCHPLRRSIVKLTYPIFPPSPVQLLDRWVSDKLMEWWQRGAVVDDIQRTQHYHEEPVPFQPADLFGYNWGEGLEVRFVPILLNETARPWYASFNTNTRETCPYYISLLYGYLVYDLA